MWAAAEARTQDTGGNALVELDLVGGYGWYYDYDVVHDDVAAVSPLVAAVLPFSSVLSHTDTAVMALYY